MAHLKARRKIVKSKISISGKKKRLVLIQITSEGEAFRCWRNLGTGDISRASDLDVRWNGLAIVGIDANNIEA